MTVVEKPASPVTCQHLIAGQWVKPTAASSPVVSPYDGSTIGTVSSATEAELQRVVEGASDAAKRWRATPLKERCQYIFAFRQEVLADIDRISHTAAVECGKTYAEAKAGVMKGIEVCEYALSLQNLNQGGSLEVSRGVECRYRREPLGVVAGIAPFNFPAMVPMWMYPIAIALGNAFILKPSEKVPLTSQLIGECWLKAELPAGVFSVVNGGRETTEALIDHPDVRAIGFVGSTAVARAVYERGTRQGKRVLALGGAKNQLIITPDADPELATDGVVSSFTGCAGQRCMAASLLIAVGDVDEQLGAIVERSRSLVLGKEMGAIIDAASLERILGILGRVEMEGGRIVLDGRGATPPAGYEKGFWLGPTMIETKPGTEAATTEIFGPVLTIVRVKTLAEAMALEHASPYGNATSVFTSSGSVADYVARETTAGMIGINIGVPVPREPFSFGGTKDSKFGHGEITGDGALDFWSDRKKITTKWALASDNNWMS